MFCFLTLWGGLLVPAPCYLTAVTKHNHKFHGRHSCRKIYRGLFIWGHKCCVMLFSQTGFWKCFRHWIFLHLCQCGVKRVREHLLPLHSCLVFLQHFFISQAGFWDHIYLLHEHWGGPICLGKLAEGHWFQWCNNPTSFRKKPRRRERDPLLVSPQEKQKIVAETCAILDSKSSLR